MTINEVYLKTKTIFMSFSSGKRVKRYKVDDNEIKRVMYSLDSFTNTTSDNILLLGLYVMYRYNITSYSKMLEFMKELRNKKSKDSYYVFINDLKFNNKRFHEDIDNLNRYYTSASIQDLFQLFRENKIRFYTLYILVKDYKMSEIESIEMKKLGVLMEFLVYDFNYKLEFVITGEKVSKHGNLGLFF